MTDQEKDERKVKVVQMLKDADRDGGWDAMADEFIHLEDSLTSLRQEKDAEIADLQKQLHDERELTTKVLENRDHLKAVVKIDRLETERDALKAENDRLKKDAEDCDQRHAEFVFPERDRMKSELTKLREENEKLRDENLKLNRMDASDFRDAQAELTKLREENERLRNILHPEELIKYCDAREQITTLKASVARMRECLNTAYHGIRSFASIYPKVCELRANGVTESNLQRAHSACESAITDDCARNVAEEWAAKDDFIHHMKILSETCASEIDGDEIKFHLKNLEAKLRAKEG